MNENITNNLYVNATSVLERNSYSQIWAKMFSSYTEKYIFEILLNQTEIRLYLPCTDWFRTANGQCPLHGKYNLISVWFNKISKKISLCVIAKNSPRRTASRKKLVREILANCHIFPPVLDSAAAILAKIITEVYEDINQYVHTNIVWFCYFSRKNLAVLLSTKDAMPGSTLTH